MNTQIITLLGKLVSINSIYPNEYEIGVFLFDYLTKLSFKVEKQWISERRFNILAEKGNADSTYLLYAHLDTVPIYGNWKNNPFDLIIQDNKAIGLGSADMKGGLVSIIKAIENFEPKNFKLKVCFGVDEENYSEGAFKLKESNWLDDVKGVLVPESCLPASKSEKAGAFITVGRKGRSVFKIKVFGKSAHGVEQEKGVNAIEEGAKLIGELKKLKFRNSEMGKTSFFVRRFEGKTLSLSIPDYAEIDLDFHLVPPDTTDSLKKELEVFLSSHFSLLTQLELTERPTPFLQPFEVDKDNYFLKLVTNSVKSIYGEYFYNYGHSVADENVFGSMGIPTLTIGPLADNHHSADEWVDIPSLEKLSQIYNLVLNKLDKLHE